MSSGIDITKPVQTRHGDPVEIAPMRGTGEFPLGGLITTKMGEKVWGKWALDGYSGLGRDHDLVQSDPAAIAIAEMSATIERQSAQITRLNRRLSGVEDALRQMVHDLDNDMVAEARSLAAAVLAKAEAS